MNKHDSPSKLYDVIIAGGGISGLTVARILASKGYSTLLLEKEENIGGLIRCTEINGNLYHLVGGHVFNTKIDSVNKFFWDCICKRENFTLAKRKAAIWLDDRSINYPIENNLSSLPLGIAERVIDELLSLNNADSNQPKTFGEFLTSRFGQTLCNLYFTPYNRKIWQMDPSEMAIEWLDGKLPMPSISDIFKANIVKKAAVAMVHDTFYYPKSYGSQHIVESMASGLDIRTQEGVHSLVTIGDELLNVNSRYMAKSVVYTGDIRQLPNILDKAIIDDQLAIKLKKLASHGTTNLLYACEPSDTSWTYLPSINCRAHRIINTGSFSVNNTSATLRDKGLSTSVLEFSGEISDQEASCQAASVPGFKHVIGANYKKSTYVVHRAGTKELIDKTKQLVQGHGIFLTGRFAEWEYYNMDTAIHSAMITSSKVIEYLGESTSANHNLI